MEIVQHCGMDVVHTFKAGPMDKHHYYIFDHIGKTGAREVYRPAPRFLSQTVARVRFFRDPYTEFRNKLGEEMDLFWVDSISPWVP